MNDCLKIFIRELVYLSSRIQLRDERIANPLRFGEQQLQFAEDIVLYVASLISDFESERQRELRLTAHGCRLARLLYLPVLLQSLLVSHC